MNKEQLRTYILLFKTLFVRYRFRMVILTMLGFLNGVFDAVSIGLLIPLFSLIVKDPTISQNTISQWIVSFLNFFGLHMNITVLLIFMSLLFVGKAVSEFFLVLIRAHIITTYESDTRIDLYQKTLHARWSHLLKQKIGYLENVIMANVGATTTLLKQICQIAPSWASFFIYLFVAFKISWVITTTTLGMGLLLLVCSKPILNRIKKYTQRMAQIQKIIAHRVNESVSGMKTIKASGVDEAVVAREKKIFNELKHIIIKSSVVKQIGTGMTEPLVFIFIALIFAFSYKHTAFNLASFVVIIYLVQRIFNSVRKAQGSMHIVNESLVYARNVLDLSMEAEANSEESVANDPFVFTDEIEFRNVSFEYESGGPVLKDVSFRVKKNEMIGIIGHSGAGKTTIADLLLRLFLPVKGAILIDHKDISYMSLHDFRRHIGYVSQDIFLMNDTIEDNIKFYDDGITEKDIIEAAKLANIYDFIMGLPKGFKTVIGEHGLLLSGGQRQRVILARAFAHKPSILLLDEATSALDNESEMLIQKSIENFKGGATVVVIAHRLSTIMRSDHLIVLEEGRIIEEGAPGELLHDPQSYFHNVYQMSSADPTK